MDIDLESMTVVELKKELKSRTLKVGGKKAELINRLRTAMEAEAIEEEESESAHNPNDNDSNTSNTNTNHNHHTDFADFEEYINDEYNRLNNKETDGTHHEAVNIDELLGNNNTNNDNENEKDEDEQKDIILNNNDDTITSGNNNNNNNNNKKEEIISDFNISVSDDPNALNNKSKMVDRRNRFGANVTTDHAKIQSRKRRFNNNNNTNSTTAPQSQSQPPPKKQRIDIEQERNKILQRAKKFGTKLPKGFKLTEEESTVIYADKIARAKRFGTRNLLPEQIKKAERQKRFNNNKKTENSKDKKDETLKNIIGVKEESGSTKLMERKLRFGTMNNEMNEGNGNGNGNKKKFNNKRQFRNNEKFKQFRAYKKNNQNNRNNRRGGGNNYRNKPNRYQKAQFNQEDMQKINQRKLRFNAI